MEFRKVTSAIIALVLMAGAFYGTGAYAEQKKGEGIVYDESNYTAYVEKTMKKLDKLYIEFCNACNVSAETANKARQEYYATVRDLLQRMNERFDTLDPKSGAALSSTEVLVNMHVLTMLVDMLTATQMENMSPNAHNY